MRRFHPSTLLVLFVALTSFAPPRQAALPAGWGLQAQVRTPFYEVGGAVTVRTQLFNASTQDAFGWVPISGGHGCSWSVTILDQAGNGVYRPGSIVNGQYQGPGCTFGSTNWDLVSGSKVELQTVVPLIYQNPNGIGVLGDPLPPGPYTVRVAPVFLGPNHVQGMPPMPGTSHAVSIPIRID